VCAGPLLDDGIVQKAEDPISDAMLDFIPDNVEEEDSIFGFDGLDLGLPALDDILAKIDIELPDETDVESLIFDGSSEAPAPGPEPYGYGTLNPNDAFPASGAPGVSEDGA
jgi:hypothetical protein